MAKNPVEVWLWLLLVMQPFNKKTHYILSDCGGDAAEAGRRIRDGKYDFLNDTEKKNAENISVSGVSFKQVQCGERDLNPFLRVKKPVNTLFL